MTLYIRFTSKNLKHLLYFLIFITLGCKKQPLQNKTEKVKRTVLIYVAGNNNLRSDALQSLNKIEMGAKDIDGNVIVFIKTNSKTSVLLKIKYDNTSHIVSDTIKIYTDQNSSDPKFLSQVIEDSRLLSPADSYGLVMWSHATSWSPALLKTKSFGSDDNREMDILDFKNAIPSDFEYIMFDACSMGSMEVIYELKDKAKYLLVSPSEVLSSSFPYNTILPLLFRDEVDLRNVCRHFIDYYDSLSGAHSSATVSLVRTSELNLLGSLTKTLLDSNKLSNKINTSNLQRLDFDITTRVAAYDFLSFLNQNFDNSKITLITSQLDKAILYKGHTKTFLNIPIKEFCDISIYLTKEKDYLLAYYMQLSWYKAGGWNNLF